MDFDKMLEEVIQQARTIGIPIADQIDPHVQLNWRAKKRYGRCIFLQDKYTIEISAYLKSAEPEVVYTVLAHELLHTCPGCMNHGILWKQYAARMGAYYGYSIERTAKEPLIQEPQREAPYLLECTVCGMQIPRRKKSRAVEYPEQYRCRCGGKLRRLR